MIVKLTMVLVLAAPNIYDLIASKKYAEAESALSSLTPASRPRFEGLIAQAQGRSADAATAFEEALRLTPGIPQLHLHAAHAYFKLSDFDAVLTHARAASALRDEVLAQPLLAASALKALGRDAEAFEVLNRACMHYTADVRPCLELALLARENNVFHQVRRATKYVLSRNPTREEVQQVFYVLRGDQESLPILEEVIATEPTSSEYRAMLAHLYAATQRWLIAARLFEDAARLGGNYAFEAADQYRMAGRHRDALRMNAQVPQSLRQSEQRLSILFEYKQYARITTLKTEFEDPGSLYRVAYAHYAIGDYVNARKGAQRLLETPYAEEAKSLLGAIERDLSP